LGEIYLRSNNRPQIVATADRIAQWLSQNPSTLGESRANQDRIVIELPLAVTFRIDDRSKTVLVLRVKAFIRRRP